MAVIEKLLIVFAALVVTAAQSTQNESRQEPMELALLLDTSRSLPIHAFNDMKEMAQNLVSMYDIGPNKTRVALTYFAQHVYRPSFGLDTHTTKEEVLAAIGNLRHKYSWSTNIFRALKHMRKKQMKPDIVRPNVAKVAVVFTDGDIQSTKPGKVLRTREEAALAAEAGITVISVEVGFNIDYDSLNDIANGNSDRVVLEGNSSEPLDQVNRLRDIISEAIAPPVANDVGKHEIPHPEVVLPDTDTKVVIPSALVEETTPTVETFVDTYHLNATIFIAREQLEQLEEFVRVFASTFVTGSAFIKVDLVLLSHKVWEETFALNAFSKDLILQEIDKIHAGGDISPVLYGAINHMKEQLMNTMKFRMNYLALLRIFKDVKKNLQVNIATKIVAGSGVVSFQVHDKDDE